MPCVVFLESIAGQIALFTRGLLAGARASGWQTQVVFMRDFSGAIRSRDAIASEIRRHHPEILLFLMDAPIPYPDLWESIPALKQTPKGSLWFDDFLRSPATLGGWAHWGRWQREDRVRVFVWDAYWREQWRTATGNEAHPIQLGVDPADFDPGAPALRPDWAGRCVFVGTVPARSALESSALGLPAGLRTELDGFVADLESAPWPIRAYALWTRRMEALPAKRRLLAERLAKDPGSLAVVHQLVWRWGKRIARLRGLRAAVRGGPVGLFCGHGSEPYAGEEELRRELRESGDGIQFMDTLHLAPGAWSGLFNSGLCQLQVMDPQSIEGGLPFRVFEAAACGRALISDTRPELEAWSAGSAAVVQVATDDAFSAAVESFRLLPPPVEALRSHRERVVARDTWRERFRAVAGRLLGPDGQAPAG